MKSVFLRMAEYHANEMKNIEPYLNYAKQHGERQFVKDYSREMCEHAAAWARYSLMHTFEAGCNLDIELPLDFYIKHVA